MVWVRFPDNRYRGQRGRRGYGRGGYGGYGYGGGRGGGGCLRDLLFLDAGCCLAEAIGCGPQLLLVAPHAVPLVRSARRSPSRSVAVELVRLYQQRISSRRARPCCRLEPSCSSYAVEALATHGTARGSWLTARRLLRCAPWGPTGADPVPLPR